MEAVGVFTTVKEVKIMIQSKLCSNTKRVSGNGLFAISMFINEAFDMSSGTQRSDMGFSKIERQQCKLLINLSITDRETPGEFLENLNDLQTVTKTIKSQVFV